MIVTITIRDADEDVADRAHAALTAAGIEGFFIVLTSDHYAELAKARRRSEGG